ncbi:MAG: hypothetical protein JEY94_10420 [Melioribacteraceae bacterium]|nr:hypothetical protein [Melioribacteraceae bacterium]
MLEYLKLFYYLLNPKTIFIRRFSKGMGDNLLLSMLLPKLRKKFPNKPIVVETEWPDLYLNNPYPTWVTAKHFTTTKRHIRPKYKIDSATEIPLYNQMMKYLGIDGKGAPELYLTDEEIINVKNKYPFNYIVTCPEGKQSFTANRKEWGFENFQTLSKLLGDVKVVQIGAKKDRLLENAIDARGLNIRESAAVIKNSMFFIGLEGGLMHLAKAVGAKAVILYGGFIKPEISGYDGFINLYNNVHCSPCFNSNKPHSICETMECFDGITPEYVYNTLVKEGLLNEN